MSTFHGFCLMILREQAAREGAVLSVLGEKDRLQLIKDAVKAHAPKGLGAALASERISLAKQNLESPSQADFSRLGAKAEAMKAVYAGYQDFLSAHGLADYDDLLFRTASMIQADSLLREQIQQRFPYVCVDEYQDVNLAQYKLLRLLCPPDSDLMVIGDPDQAIYGFRGSDVGYFLRFTQDYPGARTLELSRNYRSTETVLRAAGQVMGGPGAGALLHSGIEGVETIDVLETPTSAAEAEAVVHTVESMVGGVSLFSMDSGRVDGAGQAGDWSFGDFGVLYRTRQQAASLIEAFDRSGIPYQVVDKKRLMDHPGVAEMLSYIRLIEDQGSDLDLLRIMNFPKRGIGEKTLGALRRWAETSDKSLIQALDAARRLPLPGMALAQQMRLHTVWKTLTETRKKTRGMPLPAMLEHLIFQIPLDPLFARPGAGRPVQACLLDMAREFDGPPAAFCDHVILASDADTRAPKADRVSLMTMHAAKGLEFKGVFVTGCEEGLIPFFREGMESDPAEELRLFFVAVTRAKRRLWLTHAHRRRMFGKINVQKPGSFLKKLEDSLKHEQEPFKKDKKSQPVQMGLF